MTGMEEEPGTRVLLADTLQIRAALLNLLHTHTMGPIGVGRRVATDSTKPTVEEWS